MSVVELKQYVNRQTGEIERATERSLPDYFDPEKGYRMLARTKNVRTFPSISFPDSVNKTDIGHLFCLSRSMWANTGALGRVSEKSFIPFNDAMLLADVGFSSPRRGKEWLARMQKLSMLRSIDVNLPSGKQERQWYVNPVYFCPMFITRQSYLIWHDQIDMFIPQYVKKLFGQSQK